MNIWSQHPFFLLYHSNDIKVSKKRGFACLSPGGLEGEQEVGGQVSPHLLLQRHIGCYGICM